MFENFSCPKELIPSDPRFGSGPSLVPLEYVDSLRECGVHLIGTSHRKPAIKNLVKEVQDGIRSLLSVPEDYSVVLGNGGATHLFDMIGLGVVEKKAAHFTCGEFSQKWFKSSSKIPWIEAEEFAVSYGEGVDLKDVPGADVICCTLNETSTGVQMSEVDLKTDALVAVDATSGAGQIPCDISKVDIFFFSPQKVLASEGGLWVAIMSPRARERALKIAEDTSRYIPEVMSWKLAITNSDKNQTYNTPSISTIFFLNEQLKRMNKLGFNKVVEMSEKKATFLYSWAKEKSYLSPYVKEERYRSRTVATIDVDDKISTTDLIKRLEEERIVYGIDAYRKLGRNQFRIALFHNITFENLEKLTKIIEVAVE